MRKTLVGKVVSDKMVGSAIVEVTMWKVHPKLAKRYKKHKRFTVNNPENKYSLGQNVVIAETKPISKTKHHEIVSLASEGSKQKAGE